METPDLRRVLFERLIDDAGLFPPARLPMAAALAAHAANRVGPTAWLQGRFVAPASRLGDIPAAWPEGLAALRVSLVADGAASADGDQFAAALEADLAAAAVLEATDGRVRVEVVEVRLPDPSAAAAVAPAVRRAGFAGPVAALLEAPDSTTATGLAELVRAIAEARAAGGTRLGAKIRSGGQEATLVPDPWAVATFLAACVTDGVPFKATAGLHHPLRGVDEPSGLLMHGFVNLLTATALLRSAVLDARGVEALLVDQDASSFTVEAETLGWRAATVDAADVAALRTDALVSYGSCSFDEPTADLAALGWLPS